MSILRNVLLRFVLAVLLFAQTSQLFAEAGFLYWTDSEDAGIKRANLDGTDIVNLVPQVNIPLGIALDRAGGWMYWTDYGNGTIERARLDGTGREVLLKFENPAQIVLDVVGGKMYWIGRPLSSFLYDIHSANLDGTGVTTLLMGLRAPHGLAVNATAGFLYWTDSEDPGIKRANLDGTNIVNLIPQVNIPLGVALDRAGGWMYWTDYGNSTIARAHLDGTGRQVVLRPDNNPAQIVLDVVGGKMYWIGRPLSSFLYDIHSANLDGTGVTTLLTGLRAPHGLAIQTLPQRAGDLLYATVNNQLFTVDTQTGALTFQSDGVLQWLASPAFDEPHHTRLWVEGFPTDLGYPYGTRWLAQNGAQFSWGNPFTEGRGGPYPATLSYPGNTDPTDEWNVVSFGSAVVYAPTTERLYTIGSEGLNGSQHRFVPIMIDQYNGPALRDWGSRHFHGWDNEWVTAFTFDPTTGLILVAYAGYIETSLHVHGMDTLDPVTGHWEEVFSIPFEMSDIEILAMAVEPVTGDLYFLRAEGRPWISDTKSMTFMRRERDSGNEITIAELPLASWSMTFASDRYVR